MAASTFGVDSDDDANMSPDTTVTLVSYNIGLHNNEVTGKAWATPEGKREKLRSDAKEIFAHGQGIHIALFSEVGNMFDKLSDATAENIFNDIIAELNMPYIEVKANAPYVALINTDWWQVSECKLIGNLCTKKKQSSFKN